MARIGLLILSVLLVLGIILASFGACSNNAGNNGQNTPDNNENVNNDSNVDNNENEDDNNVISLVHIQVVVADDAYYDVAREFARSVMQSHASLSVVKYGSETENNFKVIFGETEYESSKKAYRHLSDTTDEINNGTTPSFTGYVMYSADDTVAIAYTDILSMRLAGEYFIDNVLKTIPNCPSGIISEEVKNIESYLNESRNEYRDEMLASAEKTLGTETVTELKNLLYLYNEDLYVWLANLWDPDTGGFYYSGSARNTDGFLPDLESTAQAFALINASGLMANYDNNYANVLSEETKNTVISWVKGLQSSKNGYFYHPQWGINISDAKRGRDLDWATSILTALGGKPLYDTPNGKLKGTLGKPGAEAARSLTARLDNTRTGVAVSKAVAAASNSNLPSYLQDTTAWRNYLEGLKIDTVGNSYPQGHALASIASQIKNAGPEYVDIFVEFINDKQDPKTGLWEPGVTYEAVNGLMKISMALKTVGHHMQYADKALQSAITIALTPDFTKGNEHVCSVYNPWVAMNNTLSSVDAETREVLRAQIIEQAPELLIATREKFSIFKKEDGGFSYYKDYSARVSQGQIVAVDKSRESDVNATGVSSTSTWSNICGALGIDKINLFCPEDGDYFRMVFNSLGSIVKDEEVRYDGVTERVATFTEGEFDTYYLTNSIGIPDNKTSTLFEYLDEIEAGFDPITNYAIVSSPTDETNNVLRVIAEKSSLYQAGQTKAIISNKGAMGSCYTVNFKFYYTDILASGTVMQIHYRTSSGNAVSFNVKADIKAGTISLSQNNGAGSGTADIPVAIMPMDEWVELTIEFYKTNDAATTMAKFYVGTEGKEPECLAAVNAYLPSGIDTDTMIDSVSLAYQRTNGSTVYLDDISFSRTEKEFTPAPPRPEIADFENINKNGDDIKDYVTNSSMNSEVTHISVVQDPTSAANKVLQIIGKSASNGGGSTYVELSNQGDEGACYTFETKLYFSGLSSTLREDIVQIFLNDNSGGTAVRAVGYGFKPVDTTKIGLYSRNNVTGGTGNDEIKDPNGNLITINANTWYTFRVEYYAGGTANTAMTKIYIGQGDAEPILVAEARVYRDCTITKIDKAHLSWQKYNTEYTVYADDMSFKLNQKTYVPELGYTFEDVPDTPDTPVTPPAADAPETFENDDETIYADRNYSTHYRATTGHSAYIERDPKNAANKVLAIERVANATARAEIYINNKTTENNANCYVFTTSFYYTGLSDISDDFMQFTFMSGGVRAAASDVGFSTKSGNPGKLFFKFGSNYYETSMKSDTWYELKLELYDLGSGKGKLKFYITESGTENITLTEFGYNSGTKAADKMRIWILENTAQGNTMYFDNMFFESKALKYSAGIGNGDEEPDEPEVPEEPEVPFDSSKPDGFDRNASVYANTDTRPIHYTSSNVSITTDPANAANKVLKIKVAASVKETVKVYHSQTEEGANLHTLVTKIYFDKPVNTSSELARINFLGITGPSNITLNTVNNDNAYKAFIKYGTTFATDTDGNKVVLDSETWYDLKITLEVTDASTGACKYTIYVAKSGEELVKVLETDATITSGSKTPAYVRLYAEQASSSQQNTAVYYDDVQLIGELITKE